ncbi:hypothetical protein JCM9534A_04020 [Catenuloplanes indicus JCM 9534]
MPAAARPPDLYLLADHEGVPFEDDGIRDRERLRAWMTGLFRDRLAPLGIPVAGLRVRTRPSQARRPRRRERTVRCALQRCRGAHASAGPGSAG